MGAFFALTTKNLEPTPLDAAGAGWWTPRATTVGGEIVQRRVTDDVGDVIDTAVRMIPQTSRGRIDLMPTSGFGGRNKVRNSPRVDNSTSHENFGPATAICAARAAASAWSSVV